RRAAAGRSPPPPGDCRAAAKAPRERARRSSPSRRGRGPGTPPGWSWLLELPPALREGPGRHRGKIPCRRPLAEEEREPAQPARAKEWPLEHPPQPRAEPEERGRLHAAAGRAKDHALAPGRDAAPVEPLAELHQHARDIDAHRAHVLAGAAEGRRMRQLLHRPIALEHGGEEDADGAGIRVPVGMATDLPVHGADIEAGAAAQTVERLPQRPRHLADASVVHENEMELLR